MLFHSQIIIILIDYIAEMESEVYFKLNKLLKKKSMHGLIT